MLVTSLLVRFKFYFEKMHIPKYNRVYSGYLLYEWINKQI